MENQTEGLEPQKIQEQVVSISQAELDDLKHKAEVSSQNFERAKKAEAALKAEPIINNEAPANHELRQELDSMKDRLNKQEIIEANPILKDKWKELEEFRNNPDNKGMNLKTAAKAFMVENGLLETRRQGLEQKTGGDRQPVHTGMTVEDAEKLRMTNWKQYQVELQAGRIPSAQ